jgi:hypothetical protein
MHESNIEDLMESISLDKFGKLARERPTPRDLDAFQIQPRRE